MRLQGSKGHQLPQHAPVAQLDRALPSGGRGQGFESLRARHFLLFNNLSNWLAGFLHQGTRIHEFGDRGVCLELIYTRPSS